MASALVTQTGQKFSLIFCDQGIDYVIKRFAHNHLVELVQCQIDSVIRHPSLREIIGANALRPVSGANLALAVFSAFLCQFLAMKNYLPDLPAWHLPLAFEELPGKLQGFDTVFSMGVLYHRRSPIDHLIDLKDCLVKDGELVLETLVVEGDAQQVLVPEDRYAQMRNVWFLPSVPALELWLRRAGFVDVRCVDVSATSVDEQRSTEWMRFQSLPEFLDPADHSRTVEGLPAPSRAVLIARKP